MEAGIVGLPNVGKSTTFNARTSAAPGKGALAANYPVATIEPNVGVVPVPDDRLERIHRFIETDKVVPASLRLVDIAGIVKGASEGEGLGNKFLSHIRNVDAVLHVVRCFEDSDITHVDGSVDPLRDIDTIETELMLADMQAVENALDKAKRAAKSGDKAAKARVSMLGQAAGLLDDSKPLRLLELSADETQEAKAFGFLTAKPVLYVCNVDEAALPDGVNEHVDKVRAKAEAEGGLTVSVCAKLEEELSELDDADRAEMLEAVGLTEPALDVLARAAYRLLGLQSYFTAGKQEIKAWTVPIGATAPQAAGVIHTDFEKGFIRAEVYGVDDLEAHTSEKAIRESGKLRVEGKDYVMQDGDVCHFLFNV
ncbi:MAG: redox-regulated ATPase YchF [Planctomycetota bacterium]